MELLKLWASGPIVALFLLMSSSSYANILRSPGIPRDAEELESQGDDGIVNVEMAQDGINDPQNPTISQEDALQIQEMLSTLIKNPDFGTDRIDQETLNNMIWLNQLLEAYKDNPLMAQQIIDLLNKILSTLNPLPRKNPDGLLDGADHPCYRHCIPGQPMTCHYKFVLEPYQSMSKACYDCPYNITDCTRKDCIAGDGITKSLTVVNRKMPGPKLEVCFGDTVIVELHNELLDEGTSIHWHGHHQRNTPYMDGVPLITQCPVTVGSTFQYKFVAEHTGTHFWHSHSGMQRTDGDMGALIVRELVTYHRNLYHYDLSEHVMILNDWVHDSGTESFTKAFHAGGSFSADNILINGKGRFEKFIRGKTIYTPAARFNVKKGYRYRFRVINAEFLVCPIEMSVVGHPITVISTDGHDIKPVRAASLVSYAGERFDFVINANRRIDNYWIMFRGLLNCANKVKQVALLHYEGASNDEPEIAPNWQDSAVEGLQVNSVNVGTGTGNSVSIPELTSVDRDDMALKPKADIQLFVAYDFNRVNGTFHKSPYYGYSQVPGNLRAHQPQFNHISMKMQNFPLLPGRDRIIPERHFCNESTVKNCEQEFCACTHVLSVPLNAVVEMVIIDEGRTFDSNHPMHLHGYAFRVVAMERLGSFTSVEYVKQLEAEGKIRRKLRGAPLKDTVTVPDGGYTIIRFYANNPGYWLFHCHIEFHAEVGMALVVKVGEHRDFQPIPRNFPTCGDYVPE